MKDQKEKISSLNNYNRFINMIRDLLKGEGWIRITKTSLVSLFEEETNSSITSITVGSYLKQMEAAGFIETRLVDGNIRRREIKLKEDA